VSFGKYYIQHFIHSKVWGARNITKLKEGTLLFILLFILFVFVLASTTVAVDERGICVCDAGYVANDDGECEAEDDTIGDVPGKNSIRSNFHSFRATNGNLNLKYSDQEINNALGPNIMIERYYNSKNSKNSTFGIGWDFSYDFVFDSQHNLGHVQFKGPGGRNEMFYKCSHVYKPPVGVYDFLLENMNGSFNKFAEDGTEYYFSKPNINGNYFINATTQKVLSIKDRYDGQLYFTYEIPSTLTKFENHTAVTEIWDDAGHHVDIEYNDNVLITRIVLPGNRIWNYGYSGLYLTSATDPEGNTETYEYTQYPDLKHKVMTKKTLPGGGEYTYTYDIKLDVDQDDTTPASEKKYYPFLSSVTDPEGYVKTFVYNLNTMQATITDQNGDSEIIKFSGVGGVVKSKQNALGQIETYEHVGYNIISKTDYYGGVEEWERDARGNVITHVTPNGETSRQTYGKYNHMLYESREVNGVQVSDTTFDYDDVGNLMEITDAEDHSTTFTYNSHGQALSATDPLDNTITYEYDPITGYITKTIDALGYKEYSYDAVGNRLTVTISGGSMTPRTQTTTYNLNNQQTLITDPLGRELSFTYDANKNLLTENNVFSETTSYIYYLNNQLKTKTEPEGKRWIMNIEVRVK